MEDLVKKYDKAVPRYTSYPPTPYWRGLGESNRPWLEDLESALKEDKQLHLYVHIPFCEQLCWYCGCHRTITKNLDKGEVFVDYLLKEWKLYTQRFPDFEIISLHFGGGTPNFLRPPDLERLLKELSKRQSHKFEGSFELDPRNFSSSHLDVLIKYGFGKMSLGVQDMNLDVQQAINRVQPYELVKECYDQLRSRDVQEINFDLIYGLPKQTTQTILETIELVKELAPDTIAFYSYAHLPSRLSNQKLIKENELLFGGAKRELYEVGKKALLEVGYKELGLDHFALPSSPLYLAHQEGTLKRNFMGHTKLEGDNIMALGPSSIAKGPHTFAQNEKKLKLYYELLDRGEFPVVHGHIMSSWEIIIAKLLQDLLCHKRMNLAPLSEHPLFSKMRSALEGLKEDGLVGIKDHAITVQERGLPFLRNIAQCLDESFHLKSKQVSFSRTL